MTKKSLENRFFEGGLRLGKYLGPATITLSLLGCDHLPKFTSVSDDGRYISCSVDNRGEYSNIPLGENNLNMFIYDTQNDTFMGNFRTNDIPVWPTNTRDKLAYMVAPDGEKPSLKKYNSSIIIESEDHRKLIENAAYPELSSNGEYLIYTRVPDEDTKKEDLYSKAHLVLRNLRTDEERELDATGLAADFSPDNKRIAYISLKEDDPPTIHTLDLLSGKDKKIGLATGRPDQNLLTSYPHWIDNQRVMFQGTREDAPYMDDDFDEKKGYMIHSEIFIANPEEETKAMVTDNKKFELHAQMSEDNEIYYLSLQEEEPHARFLKAHQTIMGWKSEEVNNEIMPLSIIGDNLLFIKGNIEDRPDEKLMITPIDNLEELKEEKITNLSERFREYRQRGF